MTTNHLPPIAKSSHRSSHHLRSSTEPALSLQIPRTTAVVPTDLSLASRHPQNASQQSQTVGGYPTRRHITAAAAAASPHVTTSAATFSSAAIATHTHFDDKPKRHVATNHLPPLSPPTHHLVLPNIDLARSPLATQLTGAYCNLSHPMQTVPQHRNVSDTNNTISNAIHHTNAPATHAHTQAAAPASTMTNKQRTFWDQGNARVLRHKDIQQIVTGQASIASSSSFERGIGNTRDSVFLSDHKGVSDDRKYKHDHGHHHRHHHSHQSDRDNIDDHSIENHHQHRHHHHHHGTDSTHAEMHLPSIETHHRRIRHNRSQSESLPLIDTAHGQSLVANKRQPVNPPDDTDAQSHHRHHRHHHHHHHDHHKKHYQANSKHNTTKPVPIHRYRSQSNTTISTNNRNSTTSIKNANSIDNANPTDRKDNASKNVPHLDEIHKIIYLKGHNDHSRLYEMGTQLAYGDDFDSNSSGDGVNEKSQHDDSSISPNKHRNAGNGDKPSTDTLNSGGIDENETSDLFQVVDVLNKRDSKRRTRGISGKVVGVISGAKNGGNINANDDKHGTGRRKSLVAGDAGTTNNGDTAIAPLEPFVVQRRPSLVGNDSNVNKTIGSGPTNDAIGKVDFGGSNDGSLHNLTSKKPHVINSGVPQSQQPQSSTSTAAAPASLAQRRKILKPITVSTSTATLSLTASGVTHTADDDIKALASPSPLSPGKTPAKVLDTKQSNETEATDEPSASSGTAAPLQTQQRRKSFIRNKSTSTANVLGAGRRKSMNGSSTTIINKASSLSNKAITKSGVRVSHAATVVRGKMFQSVAKPVHRRRHETGTGDTDDTGISYDDEDDSEECHDDEDNMTKSHRNRSLAYIDTAKPAPLIEPPAMGVTVDSTEEPVSKSRQAISDRVCKSTSVLTSGQRIPKDISPAVFRWKWAIRSVLDSRKVPDIDHLVRSKNRSYRVLFNGTGGSGMQGNAATDAESTMNGTVADTDQQQQPTAADPCAHPSQPNTSPDMKPVAAEDIYAEMRVRRIMDIPAAIRIEKDADILDQIVGGAPCFSKLPPAVRIKLLARCRFETHRAGTRLIREGQRPETLYVVILGECVQHRVMQDPSTHSEQETTLETFRTGQSIGEFTGSANLRTYSVSCLVRSEFIALEKHDWFTVFKETKSFEAYQVDVLASLPTFLNVPRPILINLSQRCMVRRFLSESSISLAGYAGINIFFIIKGTCKIMYQLPFVKTMSVLATEFMHRYTLKPYTGQKLRPEFDELVYEPCTICELKPGDFFPRLGREQVKRLPMMSDAVSSDPNSQMALNQQGVGVRSDAIGTNTKVDVQGQDTHMFWPPTRPPINRYTTVSIDNVECAMLPRRDLLDLVPPDIIHRMMAIDLEMYPSEMRLRELQEMYLSANGWRADDQDIVEKKIAMEMDRSRLDGTMFRFESAKIGVNPFEQDG